MMPKLMASKESNDLFCLWITSKAELVRDNSLLLHTASVGAAHLWAGGSTQEVSPLHGLHGKQVLLSSESSLETMGWEPYFLPKELLGILHAMMAGFQEQVAQEKGNKTEGTHGCISEDIPGAPLLSTCLILKDYLYMSKVLLYKKPMGIVKFSFNSS